MIESTALATMEDIRIYCREVKLPSSEAKILQLHHEEGFPLAHLAGRFESDKDLINAWRKERIVRKRLDLDYIEERGQFIPQAKDYANRMHGAKPPAKKTDPSAPVEWAAKWNYAYHTEMNRLWSEYVQKKQIAAAYANQEAQRIYEEKLAELMGRGTE